MSDQEIGKKEGERIELDPFLEAYEYATGSTLSVLHAGENPDFICVRSDESVVGLELTKVIRDPATRHAEYIFERKEQMGLYEAVERISLLIERKERARRERYVQRAPSTILVLQLMDRELRGLVSYLEGLEADFADHGFAEIWLADYSGLDAYGDIELFGLFPSETWGYHERPWPDRKPFG